MPAAQTKPFAFQKEDIRHVWRAFGGRAIVSWEMGLGKTFGSLWGTRYLDEPGPIVVIPPAHLKLNWQREARTHLGIRVEVCRRQRVAIDKPPPHNPNQVYVCNYDILVPPGWSKRAVNPPPGSWASYLLALKPKLVIADEGHMLKNPKSARFRAARALFRAAPHGLVLTGTPIANRPSDVWALTNLVCPDLFESEELFKQSFMYGKSNWWGWTYRGAKDLDLLHTILTRHCMVRRRKADVLDQLPPVRYSVVEMPVSMAEYRQEERDLAGWLGSEAFGALGEREAQERAMKRLGHLKRMAGRLKVDAVVRWVADFLEESDSKLLLGVLHYAVSEPIMEAFGRRAVLVDGRVDGDEKDARTGKFNRDARVRLLVGNVQAAGTGWNCTSTSDVALCEIPWTPAEVEQFAGRVHGIGRGVPGGRAHVRFLVAADTVEADLCHALQRKQEWANQAVDGLPGAGTLDVHNQVLNMIRARHHPRP